MRVKGRNEGRKQHRSRVSDYYFIPVLVDAQVRKPLFYCPTKTNLVATISPFQPYSYTFPHIRVACFLIILQLCLSMSFIFIGKVYQPSEFISKGVGFILIFVLVDSYKFWCLFETPPHLLHLTLTNQAPFLLHLSLLSPYPLYTLLFEIDLIL